MSAPQLIVTAGARSCRTHKFLLSPAGEAPKHRTHHQSSHYRLLPYEEDTREIGSCRRCLLAGTRGYSHHITPVRALELGLLHVFHDICCATSTTETKSGTPLLTSYFSAARTKLEPTRWSGEAQLFSCFSFPRRCSDSVGCSPRPSLNQH